MPEHPFSEDRPNNRALARKGRVRWRQGNRYGVDLGGSESSTVIATYLGPNTLPLGYPVFAYWHIEAALWVIHAIPLPDTFYELALVGTANYFVHKSQWYTFDPVAAATGDPARLLRRTRDELFYLDSPNGTLRPQVSINDGQSYAEVTLPGDGADLARGVCNRSTASARLFATFDLGLYSTSDAGASWSQDWAAPAPQVGALVNVYSMDGDQTRLVMSAQMDAAGAAKVIALVSTDTAATFTEYIVDATLTDGTNQDMMVIWRSDGTIVFVYRKASGDNSIQYSTDDGVTFTEADVTGGTDRIITDLRNVGSYTYLSSYSPGDGSDQIQRSLDGITWETLAATPFSTVDWTQAMAYYEPTDTLYFAGNTHNASLPSASTGGTAFQDEIVWDDYSSAATAGYEPLPTHND